MSESLLLAGDMLPSSDEGGRILLRNGKIILEPNDREKEFLGYIFTRLDSMEALEGAKAELEDAILDSNKLAHMAGYIDGLRDALDPKNRAELARQLREYDREAPVKRC